MGWKFTAAVASCALLCLFAGPGSAAASPKGPLVVIDPGHGGVDPGAVDKVGGVLEKTVNIEVSRRLARILESQGFRVRMTRQDDGPWPHPSGRGCFQGLIGLDERVALANRLKADLFVSVHANGFWDRRCAGVEVFYCPGSAEGRRLAGLFHKAVTADRPSPSCKVRPCGYLVLRGTTMPAVVVEMGYISNPREARLLTRPAYQERLAQAFARAVSSYFADAGLSRRP
ncbi:MAG: N-acetylmuramoyl-L-alanine amidase [Thermoanaerobacterales bacterium]|nr:N-acetylmuramoyl-L-alanine amidase [Bacillota bacterium]MDI6907529.1 N-acetylmuramoyl-L-alanine amidase [Thermoanaerobacterales bacterium]